VSTTRQRASSLTTNKNGKTPQYEVNDEDDEYSSSSEEKEIETEKIQNGEKEKEKDNEEDCNGCNENEECTSQTDEVDEKTQEGTTKTSSVTPVINSLSTLNRQRSASVSPHAARPVIDFEDVISGKIGKSTTPKKRSQTPQKIKRPSVLSEEFFKPPEPPKEPEEAKLNNLSEVQGSMNLLPENISAKPLDQIVDEVVRVLNKEDIKFRKRKNKYIWKCTAEVGRETVQLELEIMNVKNDTCGIMVRRIQGSFPCYQELYQRIKKELNI